MLNLTYILTILLFHQSLCVLINAQQDLDIKPRVWNNPTSQLPSTIHQHDISGNNQPIVYNYPQQRAPHSSNYNYNELNPKITPIFNSYYESIVPIASQPIQSNPHLSNKHNWNDITEERSAPVKPPVELHHGYRYITPAISFSNIAHLKNVIYNELGLEQNPNLPSSPQGFVLQHTQAEIPNKVNFLTQQPNGKTEILTHQTNLLDHRNTQNITILTPVKNLTFTYAQPNMFDHRQFTHVNKETRFAMETSSKYSGQYNSTDNMETSKDEQISQNFKTENKTPETSFQSDTPLNQKIFTKNDFLHDSARTTINPLNVSNVLPSQQELTLNIRPSVQLFENIQPGNVKLQSSSESTLKLGDIAQTEYNNPVSEVNNNKFIQYDHFIKPSENDFLSKRQMVENLPQKSNPFIPTTTTSSHNIGAFIHKTGNNQISTPEYQQNFETSQKQYMPMQSLPHDIVVSNGQSLENNSNKPANQQYGLDSGLSSNVKFNDLHFQPSGNPFSQHQQNKVLLSETNFPQHANPYNYLNKYPSIQNQQYSIRPESGLSSNLKNNDFNHQPLRDPFVQYQQNKDANIISNNKPNLQNQIYEHNTLHFTPDSKRQNQIIFPTNFVLIGSSNLVTKYPTYSNLKAQDTAGSNIQKGYPEHSHRTSSLNIQGNSNSYKIIDGNHMNQVYTESDLQPRNMTQTNQLTNNNSFIVEQRPTMAFYNQYINPRSANYQTESSNYTQNKEQTIEVPFNTTNEKYQPKTPIVFPKMVNNKLRSPHLVYGSPI